MPGEIVVVEAVACASSMGTVNGKNSLAKAIEEAMTAAIEKAYEEKIQDPAVIRERMMEARETVKLTRA